MSVVGPVGRTGLEAGQADGLRPRMTKRHRRILPEGVGKESCCGTLLLRSDGRSQ
jgi:hypothetical protein